MSIIRFLFRLLVVIFGAGLVLKRTAFAYIDPSAGGMLFQLLVGFLAAFSAIFLFFSRQVRAGLARFSRFFRERSNRQ